MDRRTFVTSVAVAAPTLTVTGRWLLGSPALGQLEGTVIPGPTESDEYDLGDALVQASVPTMPLLEMTVTEEGRIAFAVPRQEVGQGLNTMVGMFIAEETGLPLDQIDITLEDSRFDLAANQLTGGSYNARAFYQPVSKMAATVRESLAAAAAEEFGVARSALTLGEGSFISPSGDVLTFAQLSGLAAAMAPTLGDGLNGLTQSLSEPVTGPLVPGGPSQQLAALSRPQDADAKPVADHTLLGTFQPRTDARDIVTGAKKYTIDLDVVPEAKPVVVKHSPRIRSTLLEFSNEDEIRAMPGVIDVQTIRAVPQFGYGEDPNYALGGDTGIAIMAETFGHAIAAQNAVESVWTDGPVGDMSDQDFRDEFEMLAPPVVGAGETVVDLGVHFAHVAHAPMETMDAVCQIRDDGVVEVWSGLKIPQPAQVEIAEVLQVDPTQVVVHCVDAGGSFGRRLFHESSLEAAVAAQAFGRPVRLMWTRDEDMRNDRLRPACYLNMRATSSAGAVTSFETKFIGGSTNFSHGLGDALTSVGAHDPATQEGIFQAIFEYQTPSPYNFGIVDQTALEIDYNMLTGSWRSVYTGTTRTGEEMLAELLADAMGVDSMELRALHAKSPRLTRVIEWMQENAGWQREDLPAGVFQGFASNSEHRAHMACLVELDTRGAQPRVTRAVMAADLGIPINLAGIRNQMLGGLNDGISTVMRAGIHIDGGAIREESFGDYLYARQAHTPADVTTHIFPVDLEANEGPSGFGEGMVPTCAGAVANALYRATGEMPASFPINHDR